jgi:lipopolysaccharide/colanic/teichoic acid biosynthesis glycosyltransferase
MTPVDTRSPGTPAATPTRAGFYRRHGKRFLDFGLTALALATTWPVLLLVAAAVWIRLGRPVLFRQVRAGKDGKPFTLVKFRTMSNARDPAGNLLPDGMRSTRLGNLLRSPSLDELPELFNVLRGEMSLVGPRPLVMRYLPRYSLKQARRHEVLPGITGWAQVRGRNRISWEKKFDFDVWYVDNVSLLLDLEILMRTTFKILSREGIREPGLFSSKEFGGSNLERRQPPG